MSRWISACLVGVALVLTCDAVRAQSAESDQSSLQAWQEKLKEYLAERDRGGLIFSLRPDAPGDLPAGAAFGVTNVEGPMRPCSIPLSRLEPKAEGLARGAEPPQVTRFASVVANPPAPPCAD